MKNVQKPEKIHLGRLIDEIKKGKFQIPDFQREFDWRPRDVTELIKSIFMDYYIGTLLLWEGNQKNFEQLMCEPLYAFEGKSEPEYIVLDGQQRLTSLHYAFFRPEVPFRKQKNPVYFFIRVPELIEENYEEAVFYHRKTKSNTYLLANPAQQYAEHIFPLGIMKGGSWDVIDWVKGYRNYWEEKAEQATDADKKAQCQHFAGYARPLKELFEDLFNNYHISYISLDKSLELNKVCDIFTHINSKGKPLDTFDLLNSITRKSDIFLKEMYRQASQQLDDTAFPGFELKLYILNLMSIKEQNYCSPKYLYYLVPGQAKKIKNLDGSFQPITLVKDKDAFVNKWNEAVDIIGQTLKSLRNPTDFGAVSARFLPYPSIIPALAAIRAYVDRTNLPNKYGIHAKIRRWYWASVFLNRYSSSVESTSAKDYMDLKKWFTNEDQEIECVTDFYGLYKNLDLKRETNSGSAIYKAIFNLYVLHGARNWANFELPEYEGLDDVHIVPKMWAQEHKIGNSINSILNKTPLLPESHFTRGEWLPNTYLMVMFERNEEETVYQMLQTHLISRKATQILLRDPFTPADYEEFLEERKRTVIQAIEDKLLNNIEELPEQLKQLDAQIENVELGLRNLIMQKLALATAEEFKKQLPGHVVDKIRGRVEREQKKNPGLVQQKATSADYWMQFSDLQELQQIMTNKALWVSFEPVFATKENLTVELNGLANLRNSIRHTREVDPITQKKGEAALLWFEEQLKV